jgi:hypothetical protein
MSAPFRFQFIRTLCPHLSEEELAEADRNFAAYLHVVQDIVDRKIAKERFDEMPPAP